MHSQGPGQGHVPWSQAMGGGLAVSSEWNQPRPSSFPACVWNQRPSLPCSKPAQKLVYQIVAAGLAIEWVWPVDISRQDTGLDPWAVICCEKGAHSSHGSQRHGAG